MSTYHNPFADGLNFSDFSSSEELSLLLELSVARNFLRDLHFISDNDKRIEEIRNS